MAQWSHSDRILHTKVVYYGPAFGGKTTNLESLHGLLDPRKQQELVSIKTADDRTLFFDLLPFDLGNVLGYRVALKLYTVPGQVRYDATRQVVLTGADAVVFVADSSPDRQEQNRWSLQNLRLNMRAKGLDPEFVPIVMQFNKQDVEGALPPDELARRLGIASGAAQSAVATTGQGVLETLVTASSRMLTGLIERADTRTRASLHLGDLQEQLNRAFAPQKARATCQEHRSPAPAVTPVVLPQDDLLNSSIQASVDLGEQLTRESARAGRLEREAEAQRVLGELQRRSGVDLGRDELIRQTLGLVQEVLQIHHVALIAAEPEGGSRVVSWVGVDREPFHESARGRELLIRLLASQETVVLDDLDEESAELAAEPTLLEVRSLLAQPVADGEGHLLLATAPRPDGTFDSVDRRFMATVAAQLASALERCELFRRIANQRDELEVEVAGRTAELRQACVELKSLDRLKDRFLDNLSHEMKTPLTAMLTSATFLRDYRTNAAQRSEMFSAIVDAGHSLQNHIDRLFQIATIDRASERADCEACTVQELMERSVGTLDRERLQLRNEQPEFPLHLDVTACARAVGNLIDNALKFSPSDSPVEIMTEIDSDRLVIRICDRGPGIDLSQIERLFQPFEQGGEILTNKPAGMGIGLYETRQILKRYGGELTFQPRHDGGSEFAAVLPLERIQSEVLAAELG